MQSGQHDTRTLYYQGSSFLASKELLLLQATVTLAALATQSHLKGALLSLAQVVLCDVGKSLDEHRVSVQTLRSLDAGAVGLLHHLKVQLIQSLNVVAGEGNRYQDDIGLSSLHVLLHSIASLSAQPSGRAHLRLPTEAVRVTKIKALHHRMDRGCNLGWIRIT